MIAEPMSATPAYCFEYVSLRFESSDFGWLACLEQRYGNFRSEPNQGDFRVRFDCTGPTPASLCSPLEVHHESVETKLSPNGFDVVTPTVTARVDLQRRTASLQGPQAMYPLDNLMRHLLPVLWQEGALFHGAALEHGGRGLLACGPSGAGKSTLASLAGESALCEELTGVRAEGARHRLVSLPFPASKPGSAELAAIVVLAHGADHRLEALSPGAALRRLSQQLLWPVVIPGAVEGALSALTRLVEAAPVYELTFAPRSDVWPFLVKEVL